MIESKDTAGESCSRARRRSNDRRGTRCADDAVVLVAAVTVAVAVAVAAAAALGFDCHGRRSAWKLAHASPPPMDVNPSGIAWTDSCEVTAKVCT